MLPKSNHLAEGGNGMPDERESPVLFFFQYPQEITEKEGIASALQSFETCFMLIAYQRWPSVIPLIWGSCEGLLRLKYPDDRAESYRLQDQFFIENNTSTQLRANINELRKLRNEIAHKGWMPRDTPTCIKLFFNAGVPYLNILLRDIAGSSMFNHLYPKQDIWDIYFKTKDTIDAKINKPNESLQSAIIFLVLKIREYFSPIYISDALWNLEESNPDEFWVEEMKMRNGLIDKINETSDAECVELEGFSCPVCRGEVIGDVDFITTEVDIGIHNFRSVGCHKCGYVVDDRILIKKFFKPQITEEILKKVKTNTLPTANHAHV